MSGTHAPTQTLPIASATATTWSDGGLFVTPMPEQVCTANSTIARWQQRFTSANIASGWADRWTAQVVGGVLTRRPAYFGFASNPWSCAAVEPILTED